MNATGRLKLVIAYDGTNFRGWQSQHGGNTIQDHLEAAFAKLCGNPVRLHGAGRTDAGVHALAQCAHCDVPRGRFTPAAWPRALNAHLPHEIRVLRVTAPRPAFHARLDTARKIYIYRIWNAEVLPPLERHRAWHVHAPLDLEAMRQAAGLLVGTHDFAGFAANRRKREKNTTRTLRTAAITRRGALLTLRFEADGFLYRMVRLLTGSLVRCGQHRADPAWIARLLVASGREKSSFAAPAEGLYLTRVFY